ncbi:uncharacterized protein CTRU02_210756 [Colletotrichum truncatum]|uniref:Uncharacterized protein n=1 Tax=Colletotrichum truncatum TaxID=5467 RepID=A0ACC3YQ36_COLTU
MFKQQKEIAELLDKQQQESDNTALRLKMDKIKRERDSLRMTEQHLQATTLSLAKDVQRLKDKVALLGWKQTRSAQMAKDADEEWTGKDFNGQLRANGDAADNQKINSDNEVATMREQTKQLPSTISQLKNELDLKNSHGRQLQQSVILNPHRDLNRPDASRSEEQPAASAQEIEHHREFAAQAQEQVSDLESKLDTMKFGMQEKASEMASLEKFRAEKIQKAEVMERRCKDQEAYTVSLEKQLEELRGNMETMLGRVSVHQGKKRRRTEGPDFQL